ncbi:MAG TPA: ATP-binding protein [Cytophagaceae bacterium]|jgi:hypothetical protein|nr:ATP-binding protein [Cytophagaceae bacterium]
MENTLHISSFHETQIARFSGDLSRELNWFFACLNTITNTSGSEGLITPPQFLDYDGEYTQFVSKHELNIEERFLLMLCLAPHINGQAMEVFRIKGNPYSMMRHEKTDSLIPTAETALRLLSSLSYQNKDRYMYLFEPEHIFYQKSLIDLGEVESGACVFERKLQLNSSFIDLFIFNRYRKPRFGPDFPARLLTSHLTWNDLILNPTEQSRLEEMKVSIHLLKKLRTDGQLGKHIRQGYRALFYGESGTGKTLTATLIGKEFERDVYRVDISSVVSKYIGETSKNLEKIFNTAEDKDWILFFDEGDALFGKRSDSNQADNKSAHYANQDIAYLLQRIEDYNGLIIVASNLKTNIDKAFARRFEMSIKFDYPTTENCMRLFMENNPTLCPLDPSINIDTIINQYTPITAANIINCLIRGAMLSMKEGNATITSAILNQCFRDEKLKQPVK